MNTISKILLLSFLLSVLTVSNLRADDTSIYKIDLSGGRSAVPLVEAGIYVLEVIPDEYALVEMTLNQMTELIHRGYTVEYVAKTLREYRAIDETDEYQTYASMTARLQSWANENPDIAALYDLATTPNNHHVWGMKVSNNPLLEEDEPVCYFVGCHHGDEKLSAEVPMYFLGYIFNNYGVDPAVTYWVENREIWVLPMLNPDGFESNSRYNANGVDLNRNYSFHWGESAYNYGPYPFSEVESQVVRDLNLTHHFTTSHSYHCSGEIILYPFAWAANHPSPDDILYQEVVNAMAATSGYSPLLSGNLYPHGGEQNDYLYGEKGAIAVTSELSYLGGNPSYAQIEQVCLDNLPGDLYLLERAGGAQITGHITDAGTGEPLVAQYKILELWDPIEIYPRYSEPEYGRYRHLVVPGTWTLEVTKYGYLTQTITGIIVNAGEPSIADVELIFVGYPEVNITLEPVNPPIIIPATGGTVEYEMNVINASGESQVTDLWIDVTLPGGAVYGPLALRRDLSMPAGFSAMRMLSQYIPLHAPEGQYTMNGYVGDYDSSVIWDEDHFTFMKVCDESNIEADYLPQVEGFDFDEIAAAETTMPVNFNVKTYPNPFNPTTVISFELPVVSYVKLDVFDINGRNVGMSGSGTTPTTEYFSPGYHEIPFNGSELASGVYIYRIDAGDYIARGKMVLVK